MKKYKIKKILIFLYNSSANEVIKSEHQSIIDALFKISNKIIC